MTNYVQNIRWISTSCSFSAWSVLFQEFESIIQLLQSRNQAHLIEKLCQSIKSSKVAYIYQAHYSNCTVPNPLVEKWKLVLHDPLLNQNIISSNSMKLYATTVSTKIQSFQNRLTHKIMGTNSKLYKWRLDNKWLL